MHKVEYKVVAWCRVKDARAVESELLRLGGKTKIKSLDGYTEIRAYCAQTLEKAIKIIESHSQSA